MEFKKNMAVPVQWVKFFRFCEEGVVETSAKHRLRVHLSCFTEDDFAT